MIKKLSIFAGISFAIFGVVAVVMAQQADRQQVERQQVERQQVERQRELSPVEKITSKLGDLSNSIKKGFTPTNSPKSISSNRSRRHTTGRNTNRNTYGSRKKTSNGIFGGMQPRVDPSKATRYRQNNRALQEAPKYEAPKFTANSPAKISSSRRNPQRFQQSPTEAEYVPKSRSNGAANSSALISKAKNPTTIENTASAQNSSTSPAKETTTVQPGGYKSLRERLLAARSITQDQTKVATTKKNDDPKPLRVTDNHQITKSNDKKSTEIKSEPYNPEPIRIDAKPAVADSVDVKSTPKTEDPGWNKAEPNTPAKKEEPKRVVAAEVPKKTTVVPNVQPKKELTKVTTPNHGNNVLINSGSPVITVKTVGPKSINVGKTANYKVNISNLGGSSANDVVVSVKIPSWTSITGVSPSAGTAQAEQDTYKWNIDQLASGRSETLTIKLVPTKSKPFSLGIKWGFAPKASDTVVQVLEPKLKLELTGAAEIFYGKTRAFQLTVSNPGTGDAENVALSVETPGSTTGPHKRTLGKLAAGESKTMQLKLTATQAGSLVIRANVKSDGGLADEASKKILVRRAGLKIAMVGPKKKYAGTSATYKVQIKNPGNATAENIRIAAKLPVGAKYLNSTAGMYDKTNNQVTFKIDSLQAGADRLFQFRCTLATAGDNQISAQTVGNSNLTDSTLVATNVEALADLKLEVSDPRGPIAVGEEVTYEIRITNRGSRQAENVNVFGFFSKGIDAVSASGAKYRLGNDGEVVFTPLPTIAANDEVVLKIVAKARTAGNHLFQAKITSNSPKTALSAQETTRFYADEDSAEPKKLSRAVAPRKVTPQPVAQPQPAESINVVVSGQKKPAASQPYKSGSRYNKAPSTSNTTTNKPARLNPPTIDLTPLNRLPR